MAKQFLLVNPNQNELKNLSGILIEEGYEVFAALNSKMALEMINTKDINTIMCDIGILKNDNANFLEIVKSLSPQSINLITGDDLDDSHVVHNINKGNALHCIRKNQKNDDLIRDIGHILETEKLMINSNLVNFLSKLEELPTLKSIYTKIDDLISHDAPVSEIAKVIETDPAMAIKILRLANSPLFGLKTSSIQQSLAFIGFKNLKKLILSTSVIDSLQVNAAFIPLVNQIWAHSFYTDKLTKLIYSNFLKTPIPEIASLAGLFHNIGSILLLKYHPKEYFTIRKNALENGKNISHAEIKEFGVSHDDAGGYLLRWWGLPYPIIESAMYHHYPTCKQVMDKKLVAAVHIAQHFSLKKLAQKDAGEYDEKVFEVLGIKKEVFEAELSKITFESSNIW